MLLTVDIGNTNITFGVFKGKELRCTFRMMTKSPHTSDEYGVQMLEILKYNGVENSDLEGVIIASVVPGIMHSFVSGVEKYLKKIPLIVGPGIKNGIRIVTENPKELGADRVVDAVAAYELYGGPVLVMDFGTATTYDLVNDKGEFCAGVTAPGVRISAKALWEGTAKLPEIEIKKPATIMAQNTVTSMQAGLLYGQIGQTEYIAKKFREESGFDNLKVVATGGLGRIIANETDCIDIYNGTLTLEGLRIIYEKNAK